MIEKYDFTNFTLRDKANFFWQVALDQLDVNEQFMFLNDALSCASKAGIGPVDFLIEKFSNVEVNDFYDATIRIRSSVAGETTEGETRLGYNCAEGKIGISVSEVIEKYRKLLPSGGV